MKPILIFPPATTATAQPGPQGFTPPPRTPGRRAQRQRLEAKFDSLADRFQNIQLGDTAAGYEPEKTLVLQTAGSVADLARVCGLIPGLEFMTDALTGELQPDEYFWMEDQAGLRQERKAITSFLYLTTTNARGMQWLLAQWNRYKADDAYQAPERMAPLRHLFEQLVDIRYWSTEDRLRDTGLLADWRARVAQDSAVLPLEIELWHHDSPEHRAIREAEVAGLVRALGGNVHGSCLVHEIGYHALRADLPAQGVQRLLTQDDDNIDLLKSDAVWYFRPVGQCLAPDDELSEPAQETVAEADQTELPTQLPIAALLDGLPLENHSWLQGRLDVDDPDDYVSAYHQPESQRHGTAMASLIMYGDRNANSTPLSSRLYVRPIMQPETMHWDPNHRRERVPENVLPVDLVHRCVRRLFEGDGNEPPAAPSVRVINLSIGDAHRLFDNRTVSPWARLLDWLSEKYDVIFVVSAGNHSHDIKLAVDNKTFNAMTDDGKRLELYKALCEDMHNRRLYSPAESINAITVGGLHDDDYDGQIHPNLLDLVNSPDLPSPINPLSWGSRRSVKPDVLMPSGKVVYQNVSYRDDEPVVLRVKASSLHPPGQKVAVPTTRAGELSGFGYTCGTSNAAALATRQIALLHETLIDLYGSDHGLLLNRRHEALMLKALLIHGAEVSEKHQGLRDLLPQGLGNLFKALAARFTGYGPVNQLRIRGCSDNQATLLQSGIIDAAQDLLFELPLPNCLTKIGHRRLIITLAWLSPVNPKSTSRYRRAKLVYSPPTTLDPQENPLAVRTRAYDHNMITMGTALHEIISDEKANPYVDGSTLKIRVRCYTDPAAGQLQVPFGIVATLDSKDATLPIYEEVKASLTNILKQRARVGT